MRYLQILQELEPRLQELCHEALKEGGLNLLQAVNHVSSAIVQFSNYREPLEPKNQEKNQ